MATTKKKTTKKLATKSESFTVKVLMLAMTEEKKLAQVKKADKAA